MKMKRNIYTTALVCSVAAMVCASCGEGEHKEAKEAAATRPAALTPAEAIELLKKRNIINVEATEGKNREILAHFEACQQGRETIDEYPYIDTILELYKEAVARDWAKLPARVVQAFAEAGCRVRNLAKCCECATAAEAPDEDLLLSVFKTGIHAESANSTTEDGATPLCFAVVFRMPAEIVHELIRAGANVDTRQKPFKNWTMLMYAANFQQPSPEIVNALLEAGADVNAQSSESGGWTPLLLAAQAGNPAIIQTLINKGAKLDTRDENGKGVLHMAVMSGKAEACRAVLEAGADINLKDYNGSTPFQLALKWTKERHEDKLRPVIDYLIQAGADVKAGDFNGWTPLMLAARNGMADIIGEILERGADVNARDNHGMTALTFAAGNNRPEACKRLIASGADVNSKDIAGMTPLMLATAAQALDVCKQLIEAGADIHAKAENGITAKALARTPELQALFAQ